MGEVIEWRSNKLGYPHIVCGDCYNESFYISTTEDKDGVELFAFVICTNCGNEIAVNLKPVFGREGHGGSN